MHDAHDWARAERIGGRLSVEDGWMRKAPRALVPTGRTKRRGLLGWRRNGDAGLVIGNQRYAGEAEFGWGL